MYKIVLPFLLGFSLLKKFVTGVVSECCVPGLIFSQALWLLLCGFAKQGNFKKCMSCSSRTNCILNTAFHF